MSAQILSGICGCTTRILTTWKLSLRCFHIHPRMFSSHSSEGSCSRWMLGNAVEKSQKVTVTYVARPLCDMLYRIIESKHYITSWIYRPGRVPNWYPVSVLWVSVNLVSQERIPSKSLAKALLRLSRKYTSKCSLCAFVPFLCLVFLCETCTVHRELKYEKIRASRALSKATGLFLVKWWKQHQPNRLFKLLLRALCQLAKISVSVRNTKRSKEFEVTINA